MEASNQISDEMVPKSGMKEISTIPKIQYLIIIFYQPVAGNCPSPNISSDSSLEEESDEEPAVFLGQCGIKNGTGVSFIKILRHFSVLTDQKKSHLTTFLRLLHHHKPVIDYDSLPSSGEQLLAIDGRDFPPVTFDTLPASEKEDDQPKSKYFFVITNNKKIMYIFSRWKIKSIAKISGTVKWWRENGKIHPFRIGIRLKR